MLYMIHAGDAYGLHDEFHLTGPKDLDLEILEKEFEKLFPPMTQIPGFIPREESKRLIEVNRVAGQERRLILKTMLPEYTGAFHYTAAFCMWLVENHKCTLDCRVKVHCMEN